MLDKIVCTIPITYLADRFRHAEGNFVDYSSKQHDLGDPFAHEVATERGAERGITQADKPSPSSSAPAPISVQPDGHEPDPTVLAEQMGKCSSADQGGTLPQAVGQLLAEEALMMGEDLYEKENSHQEQFDPHAVWQMLLSELALQMPSATFNTWVRDTWVVAYEDGEFIIGLPNAYARDWLENRLRNKIKRSLSSFIHRSVQIQFLVRPRTVSDAANAKPVPLYAATVAGSDGPVNNQAPYAGISTAPTVNAGAAKPGRALLDPTRSVEDAPPPQSVTRGEKQQGASGDDGNSVSDREPSSHLRKETKSVMTTQRDVQQNDRPDAEWTNPNGRTDYYADNTPPTGKIPLNGQYTFETFVVGSHNKLAHAAAEAISENPGQSFNPLFVYGGVGLGKTHLLHSIGHRAKQLGHHMLYVSSEQFTNELIGSIRGQSTEEFRNKYRQVDILLIDDIQFISGKESTQEEFFHTFNHLHASGRQVVLSSDRPPKMLATLDDRLRSRFEGGLQTDIAQPDFETRVAILQSKANRMAAAVDHSVLMMVAERVDSNIRELEGALNRLIVQARLMQSPLTLHLATSILDNLAPERTVCAPDRLLRIVAEHFQLNAADLSGRKRTKAIAGARQIAMYFLREEHGLSLPAIGTLLGGRDHSTVRYGIEKVSGDLADDEAMRQTISALREQMYTPF